MNKSVKKPNFVSEADPNDVIKFILFDKHIPGDTEFRENKSKYGEDDYKKFLDINLPADGIMKREIYQDIIIESLNQISASHTKEDLDFSLLMFKAVGKSFMIIYLGYLIKFFRFFFSQRIPL